MDSMDREELEWYHNIQDPWDWVKIFENTVSEYCGYKYAVAAAVTILIPKNKQNLSVTS